MYSLIPGWAPQIGAHSNRLPMQEHINQLARNS